MFDFFNYLNDLKNFFNLLELKHGLEKIYKLIGNVIRLRDNYVFFFNFLHYIYIYRDNKIGSLGTKILCDSLSRLSWLKEFELQILYNDMITFYNELNQFFIYLFDFFLLKTSQNS